MPPPTPDPDVTRAGWRRRPVIAGTAGALIVAALAGVGIWRVELADRLLTHEIQAIHLPMRWQLRGIGLDGAVVGRVSIGDPARPDLTIDRLEVKTGPNGISRITLWGVRLHGRLSQGHLGFGSLDPLLHARSATPFRLPGWELRVIDARAVIDGDAGIIRLSASGSGPLRDGFSGTISGNAPAVALGGCAGKGNGLAARITTAGSQPQIDGGLTSGQWACGGAVFAHPGLAFSARLAPALDGGVARLALGPLTGTPVRARELALAGRWRSAPGGDVSGEGTISGDAVAPSAAALAPLLRGAAAARGTLAAPLLASLAHTLSVQQGARLSGHWTVRDGDQGLTLTVPEARLTGPQGDWLRLSRLTLSPAGPVGDFAVGGGLPALNGSLSSAGRGPHARLMVAMRGEGFAAGGARITLPAVQVVKAANGALAAHAAVVLSGPLPGGRVENLALSLNGGWTAQEGLLLGTTCTPVRADRLVFGSVALRQPAASLCPLAEALVKVGAGPTRVGGQVVRLALAGSVAGEAMRVTSGPLALAWSPTGQGMLSAKGLAVSLGAGGSAGGGASRFALASISGKLGRAGWDGAFAGADVALGAVPADLANAAGQWNWSNGTLRLAGMGFQLKDRAADARFYPLVARGASLELRQGVIHAAATLHEPKTDREVARLTVVHDLSASSGRLDFTVPALSFDKRLQPEGLSPLMLGIIANASGAVSGEGEVGWHGGKLTSHGSFATSGFDFAAPFGPVKGLSGHVVFTDLLGMVTAPDQHMHIASINPGIEVNDGEVSFALQPGGVLALNGVQWPFIDGRLRLLPIRMVLGAAESRRYELVIEGLNASKFLQYLDLANISATGTFDGHLPLVFEGGVGRIEGGLLTARPGGGSISYVGALSYRDMAPMANYVFRMLRSLKYTDMQIGMAGPLDGDIVTRMQLKGVGQGPGASRNFLSRQIARVPIQFNINVRAPFYRMVTSFRSFSDPSLLADPRTLGLVGSDGRPLHVKAPLEISSRPALAGDPPPTGEARTPPAPSAAQPGIQPPVSEHRP